MWLESSLYRVFFSFSHTIFHFLTRFFHCLLILSTFSLKTFHPSGFAREDAFPVAHVRTVRPIPWRPARLARVRPVRRMDVAPPSRKTTGSRSGKESDDTELGHESSNPNQPNMLRAARWRLRQPPTGPCWPCLYGGESEEVIAYAGRLSRYRLVEPARQNPHTHLRRSINHLLRAEAGLPLELFRASWWCKRANWRQCLTRLRQGLVPRGWHVTEITRLALMLLAGVTRAAQFGVVHNGLDVQWRDLLMATTSPEEGQAWLNSLRSALLRCGTGNLGPQTLLAGGQIPRAALRRAPPAPPPLPTPPPLPPPQPAALPQAAQG
jgi:hypothetical protein